MLTSPSAAESPSSRSRARSTDWTERRVRLAVEATSFTSRNPPFPWRKHIPPAPRILEGWIKPTAATRSRRRSPRFRRSPGVYLFKDAKGRVLYVGKADVLRDRVRSYFGPSLEVRHVRMVERAERIEYSITGSDLRGLSPRDQPDQAAPPALQHPSQGRQVVSLREGHARRGFPAHPAHAHARRSQRALLRSVRERESVDQSLDLLQKLFPYRTCKLNIVADEDGRGRTVPPSALPGGRPCLLFHLKRCTAPCVGNTTRDEYRETIDKSVLFLEGRYEALARDTKKEMQPRRTRSRSSARRRCAIALVAIERTLDRQEVHAYKGDDFDVHAAAVAEGDAVVQVFRVRDGTITSRDHFSLEGSRGRDARRTCSQSFLRQHYRSRRRFPPEIVVPEPIPEAETFEVFRDRAPRRAGPHPRAAARARSGTSRARRSATRRTRSSRSECGGSPIAGRRTRRSGAADALGLEGPPKRIECYDVSHVQGTQRRELDGRVRGRAPGRRRVPPVPGEDRRPQRRLRQHARDPSPAGSSGRRRTARAGRCPTWSSSTAGRASCPAARRAFGCRPAPDPDRRAGQGARGALRARRDPTRSFSRTSQGLYLVQRIRTRRTASRSRITSRLRAKRAVRSVLDDVEGVGPTKKRALLRRFGRVRRCATRRAPTSPGRRVGNALAERIKQAIES